MSGRAASQGMQAHAFPAVSSSCHCDDFAVICSCDRDDFAVQHLEAVIVMTLLSHQAVISCDDFADSSSCDQL